MKIVGVDADLVFHGGQLVSLADAVRDERTVVDTTRHVALVAAQQEHVVEIEVARFQNAHYLKAFGGFSVERDAGLLENLCGESLQRLIGHLQIATLHQSVQAVDEGVGPEERLLEQGVLYLVLSLLGNGAQHGQQGLCVIDETGIGMAPESSQQTGCAPA